jgi:ankyrin repeat protein
MQALQKKNAEGQALRDLLAGADGSIVNSSVEQRVERCKNLQYNEHQQLFAISYSTIHKAACDNSILGIKHFLTSKQKPKVHIDDYDQHGLCPLHLAAERGCNDVVSFIVSSHCDVDIRTTYGNTPMMYACKENKLDTIRLLFGLGSKLTLKNKAGQSAIHYAAQSDHLSVLQLIVELSTEHSLVRKQLLPKDESSLSLDTDSIDSDSVKDDDGIGGRGIDIPDDDSATIASMADSVMSADAELLSVLNITANNLMTPLHMACLFGSERSAEYLLSKGVRVNCVDSSGDTPLHKAGAFLRLLSTQFFVSIKYTINIGKKGLHALYKTLLLAGANQDVKNQFGDTAADLLRDNAFY